MIMIICIIILICIIWWYFKRVRRAKKEEDKKEKVKMDNSIYTIDGNMGKILKVYEDRCVISTKVGAKSYIFGGLMNATRGDKEIYYSDITSVQFKNLGATTGYLQFEFAGAYSGNSFTSENSFTFSATIGTQKHKELQKAMPPIYEYIQQRIREYKTTANKQVLNISSADEIKKYKDLLDNGIITQEEFDKKKKKLLGL